MRTISTSVMIQAPPQTIWDLLTDAPAYASWNSTVTKVDGAIAPGARITVHATISPERAFPVRVAELVPGARMVWRGGLPLGFLFRGVRTFTLAPRGDGSVEFTMTEVFSGLFAGLIGRSMPDLQPAFDEFAACLKRRAEA
ncbi:MAG: SRPBCC domain-containing protein [Kofleriaceae bacterium]